MTTWLLVAPGAIGASTEGVFWVLGHTNAMAGATAVGVIAFLRYAVVWPSRIASWARMIWLLARNATPIDPAARTTAE